MQSYSKKLLPKAVPRSCFPKLFPKYHGKAAAPKRLCFKPLPKAAPQRYSPKRLPKVAPQSYYRKLPPKVPQSCGFSKQSNCSSMLLQGRKVAPTVIPQKWSPKLLPKAASQKSSPNQCVQAKEASTICAVEGGCNKRNVSQRCIKYSTKTITQKLNFVQTKYIFGQKSKIIDLFSDFRNSQTTRAQS